MPLHSPLRSQPWGWLLIALVLSNAGAALGDGAAAEGNPWLERRVLNMAHRGGRAEAPEHTLYAYETALDKGANVLEVDVRRTSNGVLIVHHDSTVDRVTNGSGRIDEMTFAELSALDNAYWYAPVCGGTCRGEPEEAYVFRGLATGDADPPEGFVATDFQVIPLETVLEDFPDVLMSIEIKAGSPGSVAAAAETADMLRSFGRATDVLVASFDPDVIAAFKTRAPEIDTTPAQDEIIDWIFLGASLDTHAGLQIPRTFQGVLLADATIVDAAHEDELALYVFIDPNEETALVYNELIDAGVDGIITDNPTDLQAVLEDRGVAYVPEVGNIGTLSALSALLGLTRLRRRRV